MCNPTSRKSEPIDRQKSEQIQTFLLTLQHEIFLFYILILFAYAFGASVQRQRGV